ncbi:MAG: RluA family pseudouridine synthase [Planctomycetota bacterium]
MTPRPDSTSGRRGRQQPHVAPDDASCSASVPASPPSAGDAVADDERGDALLNAGGKVDLKKLRQLTRMQERQRSQALPERHAADTVGDDANASGSTHHPPPTETEQDDEHASIDPADRVFRSIADEDDDRQPVVSAEDEDGARTVTFELARDLKKRLDRYLQDRIPFMSRTQLQKLIKENGVLVNGRVPKASTQLRLGDQVRVVLPPPPSNEIPAEDVPLLVLHEDHDLIVLNKQPDIIVHPARGNKTGTVINALAWHFQHRSSGQLSAVGKEDARPGVVHRLDRHTTGVMVAAKTDTAHWRLGRQFEERTVDKRYLAVVHGWVEPRMDEINLPIGKHPTIRELQAVRYDDAAKPALTIYRVREQYDGFALVELELKTGRTHQIRVHLSHLGWPIVGDDMYGGQHLTEADIAPFDVDTPSNTMLINRQALHATTLAFTHPIRQRPMQFIAPVWHDMAQLIQRLREWRGRAISGPDAVSKVGAFQPPGATIDLDVAFSSPASMT